MSRPRSRTSGDEIPQWKLAVAAGVLGGVAMVTLAVAAWRWLGPPAPQDGTARGAPPASATPSAEAQDPPASPAEGERAALVAAVRAALAAWESFARSADIADVEDAFVVGGPQHRQFRREARQGRAGVGAVPEMSLRSVPGIDRSGRRRNVEARVALSGADGDRDLRRWTFVLEKDSGTWRVFTVVDRTRGR